MCYTHVSLKNSTLVIVFFRFSLATAKSLKAHILQLISEALSRPGHPPDSVSRNLLRFLTTVAGYSEVRVTVAQKMEAWIQNPKVCSKYNVGCGCHHEYHYLFLIRPWVRAHTHTHTHTLCSWVNTARSY